ncbi:hypothetical protein BHF71_03070 [Vulcanibacillus modesticaldus]|uniref:Nucleotidase n=1 Tax=Vulcanibacillus modesticaldus TaxID=337097 RepID=A0A1D2YTB4_9BACI|nr:hypothetical protein [Vulcanibacillus modesticaldus]OEF98920.1 hypothetical protein BHF71_03070 [Vulcanibacillus modesticaldus]
MKLGIDIDGTIKHTHRAAIKVYNEELNMDVKEDEVTTFYLDEPYGLTSEEGKKMWRKLEAKIYQIGVPLEHAPEALQQLVEEGHEIYYITARPGFRRIREITEQWLKKHNFPFNGDNLFMSSQDKGKIASKIGIDLFFEDDPEHIDNLLARGIPTVIVDTSYNRQYSDEIPRIKDWLEGIKYVHQFDQMLKSTNQF